MAGTYVRNSSRSNPSRLPEGKLSEKTIDIRRAIASAWIINGSVKETLCSLAMISVVARKTAINLSTVIKFIYVR